MNNTDTRAAFEKWADSTQPPYWKTTAWAREAWVIWEAALTEGRAALETQGESDTPAICAAIQHYIDQQHGVTLAKQAGQSVRSKSRGNQNAEL